MSGHYLPLATIAWGCQLYYMFGNVEMPRRPHRHDRHPALGVFGFSLHDERHYYYLIWAVALAPLWATQQPARFARRAARSAR